MQVFCGVRQNFEKGAIPERLQQSYFPVTHLRELEVRISTDIFMGYNSTHNNHKIVSIT